MSWLPWALLQQWQYETKVPGLIQSMEALGDIKGLRTLQWPTWTNGLQWPKTFSLGETCCSFDNDAIPKTHMRIRTETSGKWKEMSVVLDFRIALVDYRRPWPQEKNWADGPQVRQFGYCVWNTLTCRSMESTGKTSKVVTIKIMISSFTEQHRDHLHLKN